MITVKEVKNAKRNTGGTITADVLFSDNNDFVPFTASPKDTEEHGRILFDELNSGVWGDIADCTQEEVLLERIELNKMKANDLIEKVSKKISVLSEEREAGIISDEDEEKWIELIVYRKELRDLDFGSSEIEWPEPPE